MRIRTLAVTTLALAGCNSILGIGGDFTKGGGDDDAPIDASIDADPNDVVGTSTLTYYTNGAPTTGPEDLSIYSFAAYVPDGGQTSGFRVLPAEVSGNRVVFHNIPSGGFYVRIHLSGATAPTFYYTTARTLDLGFGTVGRPAATDVSLPSTINPNITALTRTWATDYFSLHSFGTGTEHYPIDFRGNQPVGQVAALTASFDWTTGYGWALPRMRPKLMQGDDVIIVHHRENDTDTTPIAPPEILDQVIQVATMTNLTQVDGTPLTVNGAFTNVPLTQSVAFTAPMAPLRAPYGTTPAIERVSLSLGEFPSFDPYNRFGPGIAAWISDNIRPSTTMLSKTVPYGNPFSSMAQWKDAFDMSYTRRWRLRVPGVAANMPGNNLSVGMSGSGPYAGGGVALGVQVAPPTNIRVNATTATDGVRTFDGTAPVTVSWSAVTNATRYSVGVRRLVAVVGISQPAPSVASIVTTETSVTIPAEVFGAGERYVFVVTAFRDALPYASGTLVKSIAPTYASSAASGVILLSATCGNGTVDAGEQCDTSGQSATCDIDCSLPLCFDGLLNVAAGEQCDPGLITPTCNNNCTTSRCGDGKLNPFAGEECEDSNVTNGDGCSSICKFEGGRCGNGTIDVAWGEECDDGNMVNNDSCPNTCKDPFCGDGILQAGEACDDGNFVSGDGCSDQCTVD